MPIVMVAGNWKMNKTIAEAAEMVRAMRDGLESISGVETIVCPGFPALSAVSEILRGSTVRVGAQNMHHETGGAYTGEVSAAMLKETCRYVILGHSERRLHFGETDDDVNLKTKAALNAGLVPIVCVGESLEEREQGRAEQFVSSQVQAALADVQPSGAVVMAYEPVWAIGTGRAATSGCCAGCHVPHPARAHWPVGTGNGRSDAPVVRGQRIPGQHRGLRPSAGHRRRAGGRSQP